MRRPFLAVTAALATFLVACVGDGGDPGVSTRSATSLPSVRIAEIHYDNTGTDTGESIEISGPAGLDVTGWQVVLYNGNGGVTYGARTLTGAFPDGCGGRGVMVLTYPSNGLQNGGTATTTTGNPADSDGIALLDASGAVVEFLSYEGSFTATAGAANGMTSVDIVARENGGDPVGLSLQRSGADVWTGPLAHTFGTCNDGDAPPPAEVATVTVSPASATLTPGATQAFTASAFDATGGPVAGTTFTWASSDTAIATVSATGVVTGVAPGDAVITAAAPNGVSATASVHVDELGPPAADVHFSEIHYDNFGADAGEAIEIEGPAGGDVTGWKIVLYNGNGGTAYNTRVLGGSIPATCGDHGVVVATYPADGLQNGAPDGFALVDPAGVVVEFLSYEGTFTASDGPAAGMASTDIGVSQSSTTVGITLQKNRGTWYMRESTFGACNLQSEPPPAPPMRISITGRSLADVALPVGFQDQLFGTLLDPNNQPVPTTFTWSSDTPAIASIDADGVFTALASGTATLRATAADGTTSTISLPTRVATESTTSDYSNSVEFGEPDDGNAADDIIIRRPQLTMAYDATRNTPAWVGYAINATNFGPEDRCDCFTFDPELPAALIRYTTAAYTGAGAFHGYGIDRGHLARSFDRTAGALDNAFTFYFSNIVPQAADMNQGPWAALEMYLGDLARFQNKEVYVLTGVIGSKGTLKNEGKIVIPTRMWKVAVVMSRSEGLEDVVTPLDVEVIAIDMPNEPGIRNVPWESYLTTVDQIEAASGLDLLEHLPDPIEAVVERGGAFEAPVAFAGGPYAGSEGSPVGLSAAGSTGSLVDWAWDFGDGTTGAGAEVTHTYAQDGVYTVTLMVTDADGFTAQASTTVTVANVAPVLGTLAGASLLPGETYVATGSFTDPGADAWSATADYGDGTGSQVLTIEGQSFTLGHRYTTAGAYDVTVTVSDDDASATATARVTVQTQSAAVADAIAMVNALIAEGKLSARNARPLLATLHAAASDLADGDRYEAIFTLYAFQAHACKLVARGELSAADAAPVKALVWRIIASLWV